MLFSKDKAQSFRNDFKKEMEILERRYGVTVDMGRITIYDDKLSFKVNAIDNPTGTTDPEATKFALYSRNHGLTGDAYGKTVKTDDGKIWKIVGAKERSQKYPIIMENVNGTRYKFAASYVKGLIKDQGLINILTGL